MLMQEKTLNILSGVNAMAKLNDRQKRFCTEYLVDSNALQAAIRAGYSEKTARGANKWLNDDPQKPHTKYKPAIVAEIKRKMEELQSERTATAEEVIHYLTGVMRGETSAEEIVVVGIGDGCSEALNVSKAPDEKTRLKAAELLGKRYGLFTENVSINSPLPVIINDLSGADE